ncbi:hypothetical protein [Vibrio sp. 99-70-13A1]|uniref:hypothetical protein n=1 Tax=Vibrio sp. 99-70-13A1 TaxID=2607601 RepID=UPI001493C0DA|nr:hypothetical protein [Vibrio sp. 99-70-13A1]NOH95791.1 hypothetical protein [Vibrio sp. 99-70-13A1]
MKYNNLSVAIILSLACGVSTFATANDLIQFNSGGFIKASEMNQNFNTLLSKIEANEVSQYVKSYDVDCTTDENALSTFMNNGYTDTFMVVNLSGDCEWSGFDINRDSMMFKGGALSPPDGGNVVIRMHNIGFMDTTINGGIHYDNGGGWLNNVAVSGVVVDGGANLAIENMNAGLDMMVQSNSRLWVSNDTVFNDLYVMNNSSLNSGDSVTLTAQYVKLSNGGFIGGDNLIVPDEKLYVRRASSVSVTNIEAGKLKVGENSTVLAEKIDANSAYVFAGGNITADASLNVQGELFVKSNGSVEGGSLESVSGEEIPASLHVGNINASLGGSVHFDTITSGEIFAFGNGAIAANYINSSEEVWAERGGVIVADIKLSAQTISAYGLGSIEAQSITNTSGIENTSPAVNIWGYGAITVAKSTNDALNNAVCENYDNGDVPIFFGFNDDTSTYDFPWLCNYDSPEVP